MFAELFDVSATMSAFFLIFVFLTNLTLLSMLIGVLCEVITQNTHSIKEEQATRYVRVTLAKVYDSLNPDRPKGVARLLNREQFTDLLAEPETVTALATVDVDPSNLETLETLLFEDSVQGPDLMEFHEFVEAILSLRQSNMATVQDILISRQLMQRFSTDIMARLRRRMKKLNHVQTLRGWFSAVSTATFASNSYKLIRKCS